MPKYSGTQVARYARKIRSLQMINLRERMYRQCDVGSRSPRQASKDELGREEEKTVGMFKVWRE